MASGEGEPVEVSGWIDEDCECGYTFSTDQNTYSIDIDQASTVIRPVFEPLLEELRRDPWEAWRRLDNHWSPGVLAVRGRLGETVGCLWDDEQRFLDIDAINGVEPRDCGYGDDSQPCVVNGDLAAMLPDEVRPHWTDAHEAVQQAGRAALDGNPTEMTLRLESMQDVYLYVVPWRSYEPDIGFVTVRYADDNLRPPTFDQALAGLLAEIDVASLDELDQDQRWEVEDEAERLSDPWIADYVGFFDGQVEIGANNFGVVTVYPVFVVTGIADDLN